MIQCPEVHLAPFREILREGVLGSSLTTFGIGGPVLHLFEPRNIEEAIQLFKFFRANEIAYKIIGNGSNLVLPDQGISSVALVRFLFKQVKPKIFYQGHIVDLEKVDLSLLKEGDKVLLELPASSSMMNLSRQVSELGLSGLEYSAGIPGTFGGAVRMNAGAHGSQLSDVLVSVKICDQILSDTADYQCGEDVNFSYRHCSLGDDVTILSGRIELTKLDQQYVREKRSSALKYRKDTQPLSMPSAGSVFRNPSDELSAAKILDDLGCKGQRVGGVMLSEMHSNWIVKVSDEAQSSDVRSLVDSLKEKVLKNTGIVLKEEIIFW